MNLRLLFTVLHIHVHMILKVASLNVAELNDLVKRKSIFTCLKSKTYHAVFLQETHATNEVQKLWEKEWGNKIFWSHGTSNAKGVAILFNVRTALEVLDSERDEHGRYLIVKASINEETITFCNLYGPNSDSPPFFETLFATLLNFAHDKVILGGDFNIVIDNDLDKYGTIPHGNKATGEVVLSNMKTFKFKDAFRLKHPSEKQFMRVQNNPFAATRLDFFLISKQCEVVRSEIVASVRSDHKTVELFIDLESAPSDNGY